MMQVAHEHIIRLLSDPIDKIRTEAVAIACLILHQGHVSPVTSVGFVMASLADMYAFCPASLTRFTFVRGY